MLMIAQLLHFMSGLLLIEALLSWVVGPDDFPRNYTRQLTEPLYTPLRKVIDPQRMGGLDLSPLVYIFGLEILASAIASAA
ncbi:MAG: YggT family protein [Proteobacteria bacterium]|nr:YggT family protein [Pseudomonadota bacterium]